MKKILAMILALVMIFALAACGQQAAPAPAANDQPAPASNDAPAAPASNDKPLAGTYDITVWCPDNEVELRKAMIDEFNKTNEDGIVFNATVQNVGEGDAATQMITDVEAGADLYNFASDQFARLVQANALAKLGAKAAEVVKAGNSAVAVDAVTIGGEMYAYPLTDNGFFMYYDKSVIPEDAVGSMDKIIEACEGAQKYLAFDVGNGWYLSAYFFGAGCVSEWSTDKDGHWNVNDDFNSDKGIIALKGLNKLQTSPFFLSSSSAAEFDKGAAVVVTGLWDAGTAKEILGDNLGAAPLPAFTVDGTDYQLKPFMGYKFIGVKTQTDAVKAAALHKLAQYLTSEEAQLQRFEAVTWAPVNTNAAASDAVKANPVIAADMLQQQCCTAQGQVNDGWWNLAAALSATAKETDDEETLKGALQTYADGLEKLKNLREGLLFVGQWNGWNNADEADTYILTGEGDVKSVTLEVAADLPYFGGRIVNIGSWETGMGAAQVKTGADLIDVAGAGDDNNIVFLAPGTYTVSIDTASGEISIVAG